MSRRHESHEEGERVVAGPLEQRGRKVVMAIPLIDRLGLNPRERRLLSALAVIFGVLLLLGIPVGLASLVHSRESDNDELYAAINAVQGARGQVRDRQAKKDAIVTRYEKRAPPLAGLIQQTGKQQKLEVSESQDRPEVPHGKRYTERTTSAHLKKAGMYAIAKFLESLEKSGYPIDVSHLNIRKRSGEPDSFDVEVGVSAYDRSEAPVPAASASPGGAAEGATDDGKEKQP
jgi:general secretion pathway protein M